MADDRWTRLIVWHILGSGGLGSRRVTRDEVAAASRNGLIVAYDQERPRVSVHAPDLRVKHEQRNLTLEQSRLARTVSHVFTAVDE